MTLQKILSVVVVSSVCVPLVASAAVWERLKDDIDVYDQQSSLDAVQQQDQAGEIEFQSSDQLFPLAKQSSSDETVLQQKRDERVNEFVSINTPIGLIVFKDVPRNAWFAPYVRKIAESGLVRGYSDTAGNPLGLFGPADNVTVEQMAKVLVSAQGISPVDCPQVPLNVTASGSWSAPYVACAEQRHWSLYADGSVDVHRPATRAEVVVAILQAFNVQPLVLEGTGSLFTDVTPTMQFGSYIARAKKDAIVGGYTNESGEETGMFGPNDPVVRAAFAKIMTLTMQIYKPKAMSSSSSSEATTTSAQSSSTSSAN